MKPPFIITVGQVPPPVTGFAHITSKMVEAISRSATVELINTAPLPGQYGLLKHCHRVGHVLRACWRILSNGHRPRLLYTGCEGDWGLLYTLLLVFTARLRGYTIFLHHHSFSYIDESFRLMQLIVGIGGESIKHIFLCETMEKRFITRYGVKSKGRVISNAAFVVPSSPTQTRLRTGEIHLGLLSNLTREKGLHTFLDVLRRARRAGLNVKGLLAGPIQSEEDLACLMSAQRELGSFLEYFGPLYGREKDQFYHDVDVFLFPTQYANEAQPTVLFEAQAAGSVLIAFDRGCIANQVGESGIIIPTTENFPNQVLRYLQNAFATAATSSTSRDAIRERYRTVHETALKAANELLQDGKRSI